MTARLTDAEVDLAIRCGGSKQFQALAAEVRERRAAESVELTQLRARVVELERERDVAIRDQEKAFRAGEEAESEREMERKRYGG